MKRAVLFLLLAVVVAAFLNQLSPTNSKEKAAQPTAAAAPAPAPAPEQRPVAPLTKQQQKDVTAFRVKLRKQFAEEQERNFLSNGLDFTVRTSGKESTTIKYTSVLVSRPFVYKLMNEGDLANTLKTIGFKKAIFSDKFETTWTYDLNR